MMVDNLEFRGARMVRRASILPHLIFNPLSLGRLQGLASAPRND
jgi:hypothetical protein